MYGVYLSRQLLIFVTIIFFLNYETLNCLCKKLNYYVYHLVIIFLDEKETVKL